MARASTRTAAADDCACAQKLLPVRVSFIFFQSILLSCTLCGKVLTRSRTTARLLTRYDAGRYDRENSQPDHRRYRVSRRRRVPVASRVWLAVGKVWECSDLVNLVNKSLATIPRGGDLRSTPELEFGLHPPSEPVPVPTDAQPTPTRPQHHHPRNVLAAAAQRPRPVPLESRYGMDLRPVCQHPKFVCRCARVDVRRVGRVAPARVPLRAGWCCARAPARVFPNLQTSLPVLAAMTWVILDSCLTQNWIHADQSRVSPSGLGPSILVSTTTFQDFESRASYLTPL
ncbi:hypothetical protein B0H14DRAFT_1705413 [Mycena olivaceomarginata]|nr:hypothetical protein B0H14DRAFT_1705413 [Mycena olivaceomarginata]